MSYVHTSAMPTIEDVKVRCHERDVTADGGATTIVAFTCGPSLTIQFHTREEAVAWVEHLAATVTGAVRDAEATEMAVVA